MLDLILAEFHFSTLWNGGIFIFIGFVLIAYLLILPNESKTPIWRQVAFILGLLAVFASLASPVNVIARLQFSMHIVQLLLLLFIAPPLLIIGFKYEIIDQARKSKIGNTIYSLLTNPFVALIVFYSLFYIYHVPSVFNFARLDLYINYFYMLGLLIAGILLWIPIVSPKHLDYKPKIVYIIVNMIWLLPFSILLLRFEGVLYTAYSDVDTFMEALEVCMPASETMRPEVAQALMPFNPVSEQRKGGILFLVSQLVIFSISLIITITNHKKTKAS